jgi:hypothetical protein
MMGAEAVCSGAVQTAIDVGARAIVCITSTGRAPLLVSKYRPAQPVIVVTPDEQLVRHCRRVWGRVEARVPLLLSFLIKFCPAGGGKGARVRMAHQTWNQSRTSAGEGTDQGRPPVPMAARAGRCLAKWACCTRTWSRSPRRSWRTSRPLPRRWWVEGGCVFASGCPASPVWAPACRGA